MTTVTVAFGRPLAASCRGRQSSALAGTPGAEIYAPFTLLFASTYGASRFSHGPASRCSFEALHGAKLPLKVLTKRRSGHDKVIPIPGLPATALSSFMRLGAEFR